MGGMCSRAAKSKTSTLIDTQILSDAQLRHDEIKMLLLGTASSGKSTILKQMRLVHRQLSLPVQREEFRQQILRNVLQGTLALLDLDLERDEEQEIQQLLLLPPLDSGSAYPRHHLVLLKRLWNEEGRRTDRASDSVRYFAGRLDELWDPSYIPTDQDILLCRTSTTSITETFIRCHVTGLLYRLIDVGGQRNQRRKWISHFEDVRSIIFLVALSDYDCVVEEEPTQNAMQESLTLFDSICHSPWFRKTSMVVFLNKIDLFKARLLVSPIRDHFPDYVGGTDEMKGREYFRSKILALNRTMKPIYSHYTLAIDTTSLVPILMTVQKGIMERNLAESHELL